MILENCEKLIEECAKRWNATSAINTACGVDIMLLYRLRREQRFTGSEMAEKLGIIPSDYAHYEQLDEPMPANMYSRALRFLGVPNGEV